MPALISYILIRISIGFAIGTAAAIAMLAQWQTTGPLVSRAPLELWLAIYGLGSIFGMGFLATSLALDAEE